MARRGDTLVDVANRVGLPAAELARFNGIAAGLFRCARTKSSPCPAASRNKVHAHKCAPGPVDVTTLAGSAIDRSEPTPAGAPVATSPRVPDGSGTGPSQGRTRRNSVYHRAALSGARQITGGVEWSGRGFRRARRTVPVDPHRTRVAAPASASFRRPQRCPAPALPRLCRPVPPSRCHRMTPPRPPQDTPDPTKPVADVGTTTTAKTTAGAMTVPGAGQHHPQLHQRTQRRHRYQGRPRQQP